METRKLSRRDFLKAAGVVSLGVMIGCKPSTNESSKPDLETETTNNEHIILGETREISLEPFGIGWVPDGHTPFATFPDGRKQFYLSGDSQSYVYTGTSLLALEKYDTQAIQVAFGPDIQVPYRNGYSAITSILQTDTTNPDHVFALTHNEQWRRPGDGSQFQATAGLIESFDGGKTWKDNGVFLSGRDTLPPGNGERVTGVGQPCAIMTELNGEKYVNMYYVEWLGQQTIQGPDQIYLARSKVNGDGSLDTPEQLTASGFVKHPDPKTLMPVLTPPQSIEQSAYIALPSISFNTHLNKFLAVCETNVGFVMSTSGNGLHWSEPRLIAKFKQQHAKRKQGDTWYSYPTLISPDETTDQITNQKGLLLASRGKWQETPHQLVVMPFELK
jgi:hypothetical protein